MRSDWGNYVIHDQKDETAKNFANYVKAINFVGKCLQRTVKHDYNILVDALHAHVNHTSAQ